MRGWILYKETATQLKPELYEINRLLEAAKADNIELEVYAPDEFDLTVTREDNKSILLNGQPVELPDFIIPRMGSGTPILLGDYPPPGTSWCLLPQLFQGDRNR